MEYPTQELISILQYLVPGFLAAWVFNGFTSYGEQTPFERIVQALIFTIIIQAFVFIEKYILIQLGEYNKFGVWEESTQLIWSIISALVLGMVFSYFANNSKIHNLAQKLNITVESSFPSEWFGSFSRQITYIVLHLKDERRLYGWPEQWPSEPKNGHFVLKYATWLDRKGDIDLLNVESIMIDAKDVMWVEFIKDTLENTNGTEKA